MNNKAPSAVFVYGTLKRGQIREKCWPCKPVSVLAARTKGRLHDLGDYPAMTQGDDCVLGEVWRFRSEDMTDVLSVLDEIEGFYDRPDDLYKRQVVNCEYCNGETIQAYTYRYARELREHQRIPAAANGCQWP